MIKIDDPHSSQDLNTLKKIRMGTTTSGLLLKGLRRSTYLGFGIVYICSIWRYIFGIWGCRCGILENLFGILGYFLKLGSIHLVVGGSTLSKIPNCYNNICVFVVSKIKLLQIVNHNMMVMLMKLVMMTPRVMIN